MDESISKTKLDLFLESKPTPEGFFKAARLSANEIWKKENPEAFNQIMQMEKPESVMAPGTYIPDDEKEHFRHRESLLKYIDHIEKTGGVTVFRGTVSPIGHLGSFHQEKKEDKVVHATPNFNTAIGYATESVNSNDQMRRLLTEQNTENTTAPRMGFLSTYHIPLETRVWRNFEWEDRFKGDFETKPVTMNDYLIELKKIAQLPDADWERVGDQYSEAEIRGRDYLKPFYENLIPSDRSPDMTYVVLPGAKQANDTSRLLNINPDNPQWSAWMAHIQESIIRDYFFIQPLETLQKLAYKEYPENKELSQKIKEKINYYKEESFKTTNIEDALKFTQELPCIQNSKKIGSGNCDICDPDDIKLLKQEMENLRLDKIVVPVLPIAKLATIFETPIEIKVNPNKERQSLEDSFLKPPKITETLEEKTMNTNTLEEKNNFINAQKPSQRLVFPTIPIEELSFITRGSDTKSSKKFENEWAKAILRNKTKEVVGEDRQKTEASNDPISLMDESKITGAYLNFRMKKEGDNFNYSASRFGCNSSFLDEGHRLSTQKSDPLTISGMIDIGLQKGWPSISVKGDPEFCRKVFMEGCKRSVVVNGYTPSPEDIQQLKIQQIPLPEAFKPKLQGSSMSISPGMSPR